MDENEIKKQEIANERRDSVKMMAVLGCVAIGIGLILLVVNYWETIFSSKYFLLACGLALHGLSFAPSTKKIFKALPEVLAMLGTALIGFALWHILPEGWEHRSKLGLILVITFAVGVARDMRLHEALSYFLVVLLFLEGLDHDDFALRFYTLGIFLVIAAFSFMAYWKKSVVAFAAALVSIGMAQFIFGEVLPFKPLQLSLNALIFWGLACSPQIREYNEKFSKISYVVAFLETSIIIYILAFEDVWELDWFNNHLSFSVLKKDVFYGVITSAFYFFEFAVTLLSFLYFWKSSAKARARITYFLPVLITLIFLLCNIGTNTKVGDTLYLLPESVYSNLFFFIWFLYLFFNIWVSFKERRILLRVFALFFIVIGGIARIIVENSLKELGTAFCFIYAGMILLFTAYCAFKVLSDEEEEEAARTLDAKNDDMTVGDEIQ